MAPVKGVGWELQIRCDKVPWPCQPRTDLVMDYRLDGHVHVMRHAGAVRRDLEKPASGGPWHHDLTVGRVASGVVHNPLDLATVDAEHRGVVWIPVWVRVRPVANPEYPFAEVSACTPHQRIAVSEPQVTATMPAPGDHRSDSQHIYVQAAVGRKITRVHVKLDSATTQRCGSGRK